MGQNVPNLANYTFGLASVNKSGNLNFLVYPSSMSCPGANELSSVYISRKSDLVVDKDYDIIFCTEGIAQSFTIGNTSVSSGNSCNANDNPSLIKLDSSGNIKFIKLLTHNLGYIDGLDVDNQKSIYVTGYTDMNLINGPVNGSNYVVNPIDGNYDGPFVQNLIIMVIILLPRFSNFFSDIMAW